MIERKDFRFISAQLSEISGMIHIAKLLTQCEDTLSILLTVENQVDNLSTELELMEQRNGYGK